MENKSALSLPGARLHANVSMAT